MVVTEIEGGEVLELPQGRGQVLDRAGDLDLGPVCRLAIGNFLLKIKTCDWSKMIT